MVQPSVGICLADWTTCSPGSDMDVRRTTVNSTEIKFAAAWRCRSRAPADTQGPGVVVPWYPVSSGHVTSSVLLAALGDHDPQNERSSIRRRCGVLPHCYLRGSCNHNYNKFWNTVCMYSSLLIIQSHTGWSKKRHKVNDTIILQPYIIRVMWFSAKCFVFWITLYIQ